MVELIKGERIKDVKGLKGVYAVTSEGRVWSYRRKKWLSPYDNGRGYQMVRLHCKPIVVDVSVHRLVGEHFIKNQYNKPQINHKNGIKADNRAKNLEWVTARENIQHASDTGLNKTSKLSLIQKISICRMHVLAKMKQKNIANLFNVSPPAISYIIKNFSDYAVAE